MPTLISPEEMTLAEAQAPATEADAPKHNLPPQTTPFFGREQELADIAKNLSDPNCRLLTILGAGGMGKTRLGIEAATAQIENFTDGVTYVPLAPVSAAESSINPLAGAMADALKISFHAKGTPEEQLFRYLRRKEMLLVFDNFEHLVDSTVFLSQLLQHAPDIKILTTSRERLNLQEEWLFVLQGLSYSESETSAIQLFTQRACQVKAGFDLTKEKTAVLRICQLVEGMPLGLELAASWMIQLTCQEIADEIEAELDFLKTELRNVPDRHRSIRAIFGYSWDKLTSKEQDVLQKLSVFRGGFERVAAREVAGGSLQILNRLVGKSLLSVEENGRYHLHELLRQFAAERLPEVDINKLRAAHADFYLRLLSEQEPRIKGVACKDALETIICEIDNVRVAWQWGIKQNRLAYLKSAAITLHYFFEALGWFLEAENAFSEAAADLAAHHTASQDSDGALAIACRLAHMLANLSFFQKRLGKLDESEATVRAALQLLSSDGPELKWERGWTLCNLAVSLLYQNKKRQGLVIAEEATELLYESEDYVSYGAILMARSQSHHQLGEYEQSERLARQSKQILDELGEQLYSLFNLSTLGRLAMQRGDYQEAEAFHKHCLAKRSELGIQPGITFSLQDLGDVAKLQGQYQKATDYYQKSLLIAREINISHTIVRGLWGLGNVAVSMDQHKLATAYFGESLQAYGHGQRLVGGPGWAQLGLGNLAAARQQFYSDLENYIATDKAPEGLDTLAGLANVLAAEGQLRRAVEYLALIRHQPATAQETKQKVQTLWEELAAELPANLIAEAEAGGREMDLWETVETMLNEL